MSENYEQTNGVAAQEAASDSGRRRVGWVGLGDQGLPMAAAVAEAGHELHVWARRPGSLDAMEDVPFVAHDSVAELAAASEVIGMCVGTDADVDTLLTGIIVSAAPGTIVANHGTGIPATARRFAQLGAEAGIAVLDAPVSGGRPAAEQRRLLTMVGGPKGAADATRSVFDAFSTDIVYLGPAGTGQTAKLFNNALMMMNQAAIADIFALAAEVGVDPGPLLEVLKRGSAGSTVLGLFTTMINPDTVDHLARVEALDMQLFEDALRQAGVDPGEASARGRSGAARMADVLSLLGTPAESSQGRS